jgi:macrodomain Ter protein organizer (MatP/YcbG family)
MLHLPPLVWISKKMSNDVNLKILQAYRGYKKLSSNATKSDGGKWHSDEQYAWIHMSRQRDVCSHTPSESSELTAVPQLHREALQEGWTPRVSIYSEQKV